MAELKNAVFLSYASNDAEAAGRICTALRAGGVEVWFDQSELRGGDAWDQKIRQQIRSCALFIAVISQNTSARGEGYFRLEWKLAVDRSHLMASDQAFLLPVAIDSSAEPAARIPEEFRAIQWTRLPEGRTSSDFVERVARLLSPEPSIPLTQTSSAQTPVEARSGPRAERPMLGKSPKLPLAKSAVFLALLLGVGGGYFLIDKFALRQQPAGRRAADSPAADSRAAAGSAAGSLQRSIVPDSGIPEKSIAVLPFVDMSEKKDQEYFSDGLSEELIDHLARAADLRVIARTSSFQFKDKNEDVRAIAGQLGVANVLEGSVRTSGHEMRITAQLIRASDGSYLWSQTYDRKMSDIFQVQDDIAGMVVEALKATLADELGGTPAKEQNLAAYELLLQGNFFYDRSSVGDLARSIELYRQALTVDANYALAWTMLGRSYFMQGPAPGFSVAQADAKASEALQRALSIDPNLAVAHRWLGRIYLNYRWEWEPALRELERAVALDPTGEFAVRTRDDLMVAKAFISGRFAELLQQKAANLARNPLDTAQLYFWGWISYYAGDLDGGGAMYQRLNELNSAFQGAHAGLADILLAKGDNGGALAEALKETDEQSRLQRLARIYVAMGRKADSDTALRELQEKYAALGPYDIALVYVSRGDLDDAFIWLERAYGERDGSMIALKVDPRLRSLRGDARYKALMRQMNFPD